MAHAAPLAFLLLFAAPVLRDLPAISGDGSTVVVPIVDRDGGRGNDNLAIGVIAVADDKLVKRAVVVDANDPDRPGRSARQAAADRMLALAAPSRTPLAALRIEEDSGAPLRQGGVSAAFRANRASGDGLLVEYREPTLVVRDSATGREVMRRSVVPWSKPGGRRCPGCMECPPPLATAAGVWTDRTRQVLLVDVEYHGGTDLCWEPADTWHAVRLP